MARFNTWRTARVASAGARSLGSLLIAALASGCQSNYQPSAAPHPVPPPPRARPHPRPPRAKTSAAGRDAYGLYCASCHGSDAAGRRARPSLRNDRVRGETDGELYWILENGSKGHGMPAWRSLGDPALWQLVQYIRALPPAP